MPSTAVVRVSVAALVPSNRRLAARSSSSSPPGALAVEAAVEAAVGAAVEAAVGAAVGAAVEAGDEKRSRRRARRRTAQATTCEAPVAAAAPVTPSFAGHIMRPGSSTRLATEASSAARSGALVFPIPRKMPSLAESASAAGSARARVRP